MSRKPGNPHHIQADAAGDHPGRRGLKEPGILRHADAQHHVKEATATHEKWTEHRAFEHPVVAHDTRRQREGQWTGRELPRSRRLAARANAPPRRVRAPARSAYQPTMAAVRREIRPDGNGRSGRSRRSTSRSKTSFKTIPAQYMQTDIATSCNQSPGRRSPPSATR